MYDTLLRPLDTDLVPNSATQHVPRPDGGWTRGIFGVPIGGEGGIVSTVDDMLLWLKHMSDPVIGSRETWAQMRTPLATHGYGLGLTMNRYRGLETVHHAGGVVGGSSQMLKVLDHELDIILMTNGRSGLDLYNLVDAIIDCCIDGLPPVPAEAAGKPVTGTFYSAETGRVLTLVDNAGKQAMTIGGMSLPARREADGALTVPILPSDMRVIANDAAPATLEVTEFGATEQLHAVKPPEGADAAGLYGVYESKAAGLTANIHADETGRARLLLSSAVGATDYLFEPVGPGLWKISPPEPGATGATLEFDAKGFRFTTGRTVRLQFVHAA
jgi:hypothetical protein